VVGSSGETLPQCHQHLKAQWTEQLLNFDHIHYAKGIISLLVNSLEDKKEGKVLGHIHIFFPYKTLFLSEPSLNFFILHV